MIVAMVVPTPAAEVDFDVPVFGEAIAKLDHRAAEVGAGFVIQESWVKDAHRAVAGGGERIFAQALVLPDQLQEVLGEWEPVGALREEKSSPVLSTPLCVKVGSDHSLVYNNRRYGCFCACKENKSNNLLKRLLLSRRDKDHPSPGLRASATLGMAALEFDLP